MGGGLVNRRSPFSENLSIPSVTHYHELYGQAKKMKEKPPPERERFIRKARGKEFPELIATLWEDEGNEKVIKAGAK